MNYVKTIPFLLLVLTLSILPLTSGAEALRITPSIEAEAKSFISVSNVYEGKKGRKVNISLFIYGSEKIAGGSLDLLYDKNALKVEDEPVIGDQLSSYLTSVNAEQPGKISLQWAKAQEQKQEGTLLTVTFELLKSDESVSLNLQNVQLVRQDLTTIPVALSNGQVKPFEGIEKKHDKKVNGSKEWSIRFNQEVHSATVNKHNVRVKDSRGNAVGINVKVNGSHILVVEPKSNYQSGTYILEITEQIRSKNGSPLKEPVKLEFSVE